MHLGALLVSFTCYLTFAISQGDKIPEAIVRKLRSSAIHSIQDLQRILQIDSVEEDSLPDQAVSFRWQLRSNSSLSRVVRSPQGLAAEAEMAMPAQCQPRTEVLELTRGMVDRSNTNFLVWPLCVEVQRCSGCCNTHNMHCIPTRVQPRHLQVVKIEYMQGKPRNGKAQVTVEDHLECRCESIAPQRSAQHSKHKPAVTTVPVMTPPRVTQPRSKKLLRRKHRKLKHISQKAALKERLPR
ncbi:platelet-derived growth factor subunit B-like isoform X3 [Polyodon spathula]|uniref:platelet-derived growth factor subunit B-like isoform X3 n=1 Tax=Polyodon spathula TaxID=7913 RepID=UPI001B7E99D3|nr:platelet-derived growth factor subunit B-like isoform X3 [Polyodon spathula]